MKIPNIPLWLRLGLIFATFYIIGLVARSFSNTPEVVMPLAGKWAVYSCLFYLGYYFVKKRFECYEEKKK